MKAMQFSITALIFRMFLFLPNTFTQDYTRWGLPEGAEARLGKGRISGNIAYSPDGALLAVATGIGIWLYDTGPYREVALLTGHTDGVSNVAFSPDGTTLASGSRDGTVLLWELSPTQESPLLGDVNYDGVVNAQDLVIVAAQFGQRVQNDADVNGDGVVSIFDLVTVAGLLSNAASAP